MAVDISGSDGSLFWKAGIDTSDFDKGMQKITDTVQQSVQKQIQLQEQAAQGQKQVAQSILQSAGLIKGMDQGIESQVQHLAELQKHIQTLKGQSLDMGFKGFDTTNLTLSLDKVLSEIEKIRNNPLELKTGNVDVAPLLNALQSVESEFNKVQSNTLQIKVGGINTESVEKAFTGLQAKMNSLEQTALDLKVKGIDTSSLTTAIDKAKQEFESLRGLTLSPELDLTEFQKKYSEVQKSLSVLEAEKIELKAAGIDTTQIEKDITTIRTQTASISRQALKITVDDSNLQGLEKHFQALQTQFTDFKAAGIDTTQLENALAKVKVKIEEIKAQPVEVRTGTVNLEPLSVALSKVLQQVQAIDGTSVNINVAPVDTESVLKSFDTAFASLKNKVESLQTAAINLKVGDIDTTSLTTSLERAQQKLEQLKSFQITGTATLNDEQFQTTYKELLGEIDNLKTQAIVLKAAGLDTTGVEADLQRLRSSVEQINSAEGLQSFAKKQIAALQSVSEVVDQSEQDLKDYLAAVDQFNKEGVSVPVNQRAPDSPKVVAATQGHLPLDEANLKTLEASRKIFADLDSETQQFIKELVELEGQLDDVKKAQKELDAEREKGNITTRQYVQATEALAAQEKNIGQSITLIGQRQKEYEKSLEPVIEKTVSAQTRLSQLKKEMASNPGSPMFETWQKEAVELQASINRVNQELKNAVALQQLNNRKANLQGLLVTEQDTSKVKAYQKELGLIEGSISKLGNAGKEGFNEVGEAIAQTATKSSLLTKTWGLLRNAAILIPGLSMAGIFNIIGEAVISLVTSLIKGKQAFDEIGAKIKLFNEVNAEANRQAASQITDLKLLYSVATDVNKAMKDRLEAVKGLKAEFPDTFANIKNEIILNGQAKQSYLDLIPAIQAASRAKAAKDKIDELEAQRLDIAFQKQKINNAADQELAQVKPISGKNFLGEKVVSDESIKEREEFDKKVINSRKDAALKEQDINDKRLENQEKFLVQFAGGEQKLVKTVTDGNKELIAGSVEAIDADIANQKRLQSHFSTTSKQYQDYQKTINGLEEKRKQIVGSSKSEINANGTEENKLLSKRFSLLQQISALQHDATQSGLLKDASELDKINEKYDKAIESAKEFNKQAELHNQKVSNQKNKIKLIDTDVIESLRTQEVNNELLKQDAEKFKQNLEQQKAIFEQYEEAKKQIGVEKANEMFEEQRKGFTSYGEFLRNEFAKMLPKIQLGLPGNIGDKEKFKALLTAGGEEQKKQVQRQIELQKELFEKTATFADQKLLIEQHYSDLTEALKKKQGKISEEEFDRESAALEAAKQRDLASLEDLAVQQSEIYKKMGQNTLRLTKDQLKDQISEIDKVLKQGFLVDAKGKKQDLTPKMIEDLQGAKDQAQALLNLLAKSTTEAGKLATAAGKAAVHFSQLSQAIAPLNKDLSDALATMSQMVSAASDIAGGIASIEAGGIENILSGGIGIIGGIGKFIGGLFGESPEEKAFKERMKKLQTDIFTGEFTINALYRERELSQIRLNDLRLQGAKQEIEALQKQKTEIEKEADEVLKKLQQQTFTATTDQILQFAKDNNLNAFQIIKLLGDHQVSLAGKTFDELEKLDAFGQLEGTAKTLFDTLKKLKEEGIDVDKQLQELQKQIAVDLTGGATKENIADSIAEGFAQGKRSAADFADTFKDLMQKAALAALKLRFLDEPLKKFIEQFQADVQSGDQLDSSEVANLKQFWDNMISNASKAMDQLQKISGVDFNSVTGSSPNSLQGAIKNITEESAQLLAGQFGGLRLTAIEQLNVAMQQLDRLNAIQNNTANTVQELKSQTATMVEFFQNRGVKIA